MNIQPHTWIEISKSAFEHNIALYKKIIGEQTKLGVVVKSNAYGHGLKEIIVLSEPIDDIEWFFVAHLSEAIELREYGITRPILIMSSLIADYDYACMYNIDLMVDNIQTINMINQTGQKFKKKIHVHLKVDTGLSRFGCLPDTTHSLIAHVQTLPFVHLNGIYTHFAESNNSELEFTLKQARIFNDILEQYSDIISWRHMANTAGITAIKNNYINLVRLGAGAYGLWSSEATRNATTSEFPFAQLRPLLTWKTRIVAIKDIPADSFVGYNRTYMTQRPTRMAILPVGYYDGYDKRLSNKGLVRIKGQNAPIIGVMSMNLTTVDISHIPSTSVGDEVIIMGNHPNISSYDLANQTGCFNTRQMITQINPSIKRIIVA